MNLVKLTIGVLALALLVVGATMMPAHPSKAFANETLREPRMIDPCLRTCNIKGENTRYCGTGGLQYGCDHVVNNQCVFILCN